MKKLLSVCSFFACYAISSTSFAEESEAPPEETSLAGHHGGVFYLRDRDDNFRLYLQGRAQIDGYAYAGPGVTDTALKPTLLLRRVRPELTGELFGNTFQFMLAGDFGQSAYDNAKGTNETSAAGPGKAPTATSGRYASAETASIKATATDVWIGYRAASTFNLQLGQYDAPFTMENRTSDKYIAYMERSLAVRNLGIPSNKELGLMAWGETANKTFFYSVGIFDGDGQGRPSPDARPDAMGRIFVHPLKQSGGPLSDLQIGGSARFGRRDSTYVTYDYNAFTTQAGYTFWSPIYTGAHGPTHVLPSGRQLGWAIEMRVPYGDHLDLTGEYVSIHNQTREALEGFQATNTERTGVMSGYAYYLQLGVWPFGHRDINGAPGYENPTHVDFKKPNTPPKHALQLLVKWEQLSAKYDSAARRGTADDKNIDGNIRADVLSFGANYWMTKHLRFSANYMFDMFPGSQPSSSQTADQRATAPGNGLPKGVNDAARESAHVLHEVTFRVAVAL